MDRKQPLIIVAGADYGQGEAPARLGGQGRASWRGGSGRRRRLRAHHRTNLIGMGVLPVEFKRASTA